MDAGELASRFALGGAARLSRRPVARGKQGEVWRLDTTDGRWAVKVPFAGVTEDEVNLAAEFQEAAYRAGVPTPQLRRSTEGRVFAEVRGRAVRVYEWIDLCAPDRHIDPAAVGAIVAALHRVAPSRQPGPLHPWYGEPVGAARWDELLRQLEEAGAPFAARLAGHRDELVALESWLEPPETLRTCHRDLWADNVLATPAGDLCVIDWENSGSADPRQEFACVLFEFARDDPGRVRSLTDAYLEAGGPARVERRGHFSMLIAQLGHVTEIAATDWLTPNPRSPSRRDAAAWIAGVLDDPLTRERLEALLALARLGDATI